MKSSSTSDGVPYGRIFSFLFIWIVTTATSLFAGHFGGYVAGIRPGGWNIHMIYPPLFGGFTGLVSYPILRFSLRIGSADKDKGLFLGMLIAVVLAFVVTFFLIKANG